MNAPTVTVKIRTLCGAAGCRVKTGAADPACRCCKGTGYLEREAKP